LIRRRILHQTVTWLEFTWQRSELTDIIAKVVIYEAFVGGKLEAPKYLARTVYGSLLRTEL
jgi:hypothetical protein